MASLGELRLLWDIRSELTKMNELMEEEKLRREWEQWDREYKKKTIERIRAGENLFTLKGQPVYPNMSLEQIAGLIENGELYLINYPNINKTGILWSNENRAEAQNPAYLEVLKLNQEAMQNGNYRIIK